MESENWKEDNIIPNSTKKLRACLKCHLVKTEQQFYEFGCENCEDLGMKEDKVRVRECTSQFFVGLISIIEPEDSWVARWNKLDKFYPGCYCIDVVGSLPEFIEQTGPEYGRRKDSDF